MGSGSSNFTSHQSSEIVRQMKEEYNKIIINNPNLSIDKQQDILIKSYNDIVITVINTPHYMIPKGVKTSKTYHRGISKDINNSNTTNGTNKTRRRSFDNKKYNKSNSNVSNTSNTLPINIPIIEKSESLQESQSSPNLPSTEEQGNILYLLLFILFIILFVINIIDRYS